MPGELARSPACRLFESHRGASAGSAAPPAAAASPQQPAHPAADTLGPGLLPPRQETPWQHWKGGVCGNCSISCFSKHMVVFIVLLGFFTMQLTVSTAAQNQCVYSRSLHTGVQIMVCSSPVQYIHIDLFLILAPKATVPNPIVGGFILFRCVVFLNIFSPLLSPRALASTQPRACSAAACLDGSTLWIVG